MGTSQAKYEQKDLPPSEDNRLNYLLIGKTGNGKSSSGNAIAGKDAFQTFNSTTAGTKRLWTYETSKFGKDIFIVDTPGLIDTEDLSDVEFAKFARKYMTKAFKVCSKNFKYFNAFLIVLSVSQRFTAEDENVIKLLTEIFGEAMFDYTILIFTHGDDFDRQHDLTDAYRSQERFKLWCKYQQGNLGALLKNCQYRAVLFHNINQYQRGVELLAFEKEVETISIMKGCYTEKMFQNNEHRRKHLILKLYGDRIQEEIKRKLSSLQKELLLITSNGKTFTDTTENVLKALKEQGSKYPNLDTLNEKVKKLHIDFANQKSNQDKVYLVKSCQDVFDGDVFRELRSLNKVIFNIINTEKHKEKLKIKAKALLVYIEEEALGTNELNACKDQVTIFLRGLEDLDTQANSKVTEYN